MDSGTVTETNTIKASAPAEAGTSGGDVKKKG
jgi:hypothetical protein